MQRSTLPHRLLHGEHKWVVLLLKLLKAPFLRLAACAAGHSHLVFCGIHLVRPKWHCPGCRFARKYVLLPLTTWLFFEQHAMRRVQLGENILPQMLMLRIQDYSVVRLAGNCTIKENTSGNTAHLVAQNFDARWAGILIWTGCKCFGCFSQGDRQIDEIRSIG